MPARHGQRLHRRGAEQQGAGQHEQGETLGQRECATALKQPAVRTERKRGPLEWELRDVGQERGSVGAQRGADRQYVDADAAGENGVSDRAGGIGAVGSYDAEQQGPGRDREVVGREREGACQLGRRRVAGLQAQREQMADR